jgi:hypothetical protein
MTDQSVERAPARLRIWTAPNGERYRVLPPSTSNSFTWLALNEAGEIMCALKFKSRAWKRYVNNATRRRWPYATGVLAAKRLENSHV